MKFSTIKEQVNEVLTCETFYNWVRSLIKLTKNFTKVSFKDNVSNFLTIMFYNKEIKGYEQVNFNSSSDKYKCSFIIEHLDGSLKEEFVVDKKEIEEMENSEELLQQIMEFYNKNLVIFMDKVGNC